MFLVKHRQSPSLRTGGPQASGPSSVSRCRACCAGHRFDPSGTVPRARGRDRGYGKAGDRKSDAALASRRSARSPPTPAPRAPWPGFRPDCVALTRTGLLDEEGSEHERAALRTLPIDMLSIDRSPLPVVSSALPHLRGDRRTMGIQDRRRSRVLQAPFCYLTSGELPEPALWMHCRGCGRSALVGNIFRQSAPGGSS
jgi:hypothetical protein